MNRHTMIATVLASGCASAALAQLGNATITWEADDGRGWTSTRLETTAPSVQVRMRVEWDQRPTTGNAFAGLQFDAVTTGPADALDNVSNARRLYPFDRASAQTLSVMRFGSSLKIDDSRDTLPPGTGPRGIFPGQLAPGFGDTNFTTSNPVSVFAFSLQFDATPGTRRINSLYIAPSGGDTVSRYLRLYLPNTGGAQNTPSTITLPLDIVYIPAPSGTLLALTAGAMALRPNRRRR